MSLLGLPRGMKEFLSKGCLKKETEEGCLDLGSGMVGEEPNC